MAVPHVTKENFDEVIQSKEPVLIDFFATWCGPCKMQMPILEELNGQVDNFVGKVDIDADSELAARYGVMSVPTLMVFQDGQPIATQVGVQSTPMLKKMLGK